MFSIKEKQYIASEIEKLLLGLNHPEMQKDKAMFILRVDGKEDRSWAEIKPNWYFSKDNPPKINPWNENARETMGKE